MIEHVAVGRVQLEDVDWLTGLFQFDRELVRGVRGGVPVLIPLIAVELEELLLRVRDAVARVDATFGCAFGGRPGTSQRSSSTTASATCADVAAAFSSRAGGISRKGSEEPRRRVACTRHAM